MKGKKRDSECKKRRRRKENNFAVTFAFKKETFFS